MYAKTAAEILGITPRALRALHLPRRVVRNAHYSRGSAYLYDPRDLLRVQKDPAVIAARRRKAGAGARQPKDYASLLAKRHSSRREALRPAAEAMWNLNRYAKHASCTAEHRARIYALKSDFLKHLCSLGLLVGRGLHVVRRAARKLECYGCYGAGCERCDETGIYAEYEEKTIEYMVLLFEVNGQRYTWHQPTASLEWDVPEAPLVEKGDWTPGEVKPISMNRSRFAEAKALIEWAIEGDGTSSARV